MNEIAVSKECPKNQIANIIRNKVIALQRDNFSTFHIENWKTKLVSFPYIHHTNGSQKMFKDLGVEVAYKTKNLE